MLQAQPDHENAISHRADVINLFTSEMKKPSANIFWQQLTCQLHNSKMVSLLQELIKDIEKPKDYINHRVSGTSLPRVCETPPKQSYKET